MQNHNGLYFYWLNGSHTFFFFFLVVLENVYSLLYKNVILVTKHPGSWRYVRFEIVYNNCYDVSSEITSRTSFTIK